MSQRIYELKILYIAQPQLKTVDKVYGLYFVTKQFNLLYPPSYLTYVRMSATKGIPSVYLFFAKHPLPLIIHAHYFSSLRQRGEPFWFFVPLSKRFRKFCEEKKCLTFSFAMKYGRLNLFMRVIVLYCNQEKE